MRYMWIFLAGMAIVGAFIFGRLNSGKMTPETDAPPEMTELQQAYENFISAQTETLDFFAEQEFFDNSQNRAEAYRTLLWSMVGAIKLDGLHDPAHPRFIRWVDWTSKSGMDNPDNTYFFTQIQDNGEYKITGTRGTTAGLVFQLLMGQPGVGDAGTSTNVDVLYADDLVTDIGGAFEILVSREKPDTGNWLQLKDDAKTLILRHTHSNWESEEIGKLNIISLKSDIHAPVLTDEIMAARLNATATAIRDRNKSWITLANTIWSRAPKNIMTPPRPTPGGLVGQYSAFARFDIAEDEALILTSYTSNADYQGIQLGNRWFTSLDYETRTSSLTPVQSYQSSDGAYHYVISARDPKVQNWLDTESHRQGLIMMRWQGKSAAPPQAPEMRLVKLADLKDELPKDMPVFSRDNRADQIRKRQLAVEKRFP